MPFGIQYLYTQSKAVSYGLSIYQAKNYGAEREKGVAEYKMSLELGHSRNYIQNIANGK